MKIATDCRLALPGWAKGWMAQREDRFADDSSAMTCAIAMARENVRQETGGPFAALVIGTDSGRLLSAGVNVVVDTHLSIAHAEIMAISLAEEYLHDWNLARHGSLTLVSTCEPCAMCYGALPWSGIQRLVYGSEREDAERAGFDEGEKPGDWKTALERRSIEVRGGVLRGQANMLFALYRDSNGELYNPA